MASAAASLSCRRALGGASASVSGRARQLVSRRCAVRPAQPAAPCALLRVRDDLREPGVTDAEVVVRIALTGPLASLKRSDVACKIMPRKLRLLLDGGGPALEGDLEASVNDQGSYWQFEEVEGGNRMLKVVLEKRQGAAHWEYMLDSDVTQVDAEITDEAFFDVTLDDEFLGRIGFGLFGKVVPRTAANFLALCTGQAGSAPSGAALHYKGSTFHRVIPGFMCQGGDFTAGDGTGGWSIYGERFADESFQLPHSGPFLLSMANAGPDSNGSQFFITTAACAHLDGKHVVFGRVTSGEEVVKRIEACGSRSGVLDGVVRVVECGRLATRGRDI